MMASHDDVLRWRGRTSDTVAAVAHRLKDTYSSAYYVPEHHGSPWQSVKLAHEVADKIISISRGETWNEFRLAVCNGLQTERQGFFTDDMADPDGYVCATLGEFISALTPSGPVTTQEPAPRPPLGLATALVILVCTPILLVILAISAG
ncbi:hypothetical protein A6A04_19380 [Paramagnetospirillum marisnigri]|uniref:Uncharacterized protein n=1 Tax=Paramagnetospirillum marisnigri TaxID=1285242 RepID=A0A178MLA0_9PROT|nr:hypothetical protein [Paramagnetospirillum marisnigri]OAN49446.1 hypothetical protein A6A04_19380 [Paramagnetospirillum marisnigri]